MRARGVGFALIVLDGLESIELFLFPFGNGAIGLLLLEFRQAFLHFRTRFLAFGRAFLRRQFLDLGLLL